MSDATGLMRVPEEWVPIAVIVVGGLMLVVIMVLHGFGLDRVAVRYKTNAERMRMAGWPPSLAVLLFALTILKLLLLHLVEIALWGLLIWRGGLVSNLHSAAYFSANTYTTLGMGNMVLPHTWHELSPMIAISGLFAFAWTTSELFNIVGYQHDLVKELTAKREQKKHQA
jgi:hypothetical protein